jgi:site-specific DNA recombinase
LDRLNRAEPRLLEAYLAEVISLEELHSQRTALKDQRRSTEEQLEQHWRLRQQCVQAEEALTSLATFSDRIRSRLQTASVTERQAILQLVIERIIVHDGSLEIQHVIPLRDPSPGTTIDSSRGKVGLRSDGLRAAAGEFRTEKFDPR